MNSSSKKGALKEGLEQVRQEVDSWPSWMRTNETNETIRQGGDARQGPDKQSCSPGTSKKR